MVSPSPAEKKKSLSHQAYQLIRADILTCKFMPGEQVAQAALVEKYQFGTTPIREALQRLAQEGLVRSIPRFGYEVSHITLADVEEIYELRAEIEPGAARLAALRATAQQMEAITTSADFTYTYGDRESYTRFLGLNARFHNDIATASGNRRLADLVASVLDELLRVFHLGLDLKDSAEEMRAQHLALVQALANRDASQAERLAREEIESSKERVLAALQQQFAAHGALSPVERLQR
jgi:DNA-binding GntR family transcriptional regulator